jgi:hypothetical protein
LHPAAATTTAIEADTIAILALLLIISLNTFPSP